MENSVDAFTGILPVYKPNGMVSKDVSRVLKKLLPRRTKIGHVGTLDPLAEGVLPILIGRATKVQDLLLHSPKTYVATFELGRSTDSQDAEGAVVEERSVPAGLGLADFQEAAKQYVGLQTQIPPIYSAVKYQGKPLYSYAREGRAAEVPLNELGREIEVYQLDVLSYDGNRLTFRANCSKGTYIRVLGVKLAESLGCLSHMVGLVRESTAGINASTCVDLAEFESESEVLQNLISIDHASFPQMSKRLMSQADSILLQHGRKVEVGAEEAERLRKDDFILRDNTGHVFGLGRIVSESGNTWIHMKRGLL